MEFNGRSKRRNFGPWTRRLKEHIHTDLSLLSTVVFDSGESFKCHLYDNMDLTIDAKRAALKISPSVVSLVIGDTGKGERDTSKGEYFRMRDIIKKEKQEWNDGGGETCLQCSGTIIGCDGVDGKYVSTILTSCSLIRSFINSGVILNDVKIDVYLSNRQLFKGKIYSYDIYYNVAVVKIQSPNELPVATLRHINDSMSIDPNHPKHESASRLSMELRSHSNTFNLYPGEMLVAVGRHFKGYDLMAAAGVFSLDVCSLDSDEVFRANYVISKCGIGGPVVNLYGEVIGVNFINKEYTPFLPINIASKCIEQLNKYGRSSRPWLGTVMTNLYAARLAHLEKNIQNFPDICRGVIVEEVIPDSPADRAGVLCNDVIIQCNKNYVSSYLEFLAMIWDKTGESVELVIVRTRDGGVTTFKLVVDVVNSHKINRWPLPEPRKIGVEAYRFGC